MIIEIKLTLFAKKICLFIIAFLEHLNNDQTISFFVHQFTVIINIIRFMTIINSNKTDKHNNKKEEQKGFDKSLASALTARTMIIHNIINY